MMNHFHTFSYLRVSHVLLSSVVSRKSNESRVWLELSLSVGLDQLTFLTMGTTTMHSLVVGQCSLTLSAVLPQGRIIEFPTGSLSLDL